MNATNKTSQCEENQPLQIYLSKSRKQIFITIINILESPPTAGGSSTVGVCYTAWIIPTVVNRSVTSLGTSQHQWPSIKAVQVESITGWWTKTRATWCRSNDIVGVDYKVLPNTLHMFSVHRVCGYLNALWHHHRC